MSFQRFKTKTKMIMDYGIEAKLISATLLRVEQFAEQVPRWNVNFVIFAVKIKAKSMS